MFHYSDSKQEFVPWKVGGEVLPWKECLLPVHALQIIPVKHESSRWASQELSRLWTSWRLGDSLKWMTWRRLGGRQLGLGDLRRREKVMPAYYRPTPKNWKLGAGIRTNQERRGILTDLFWDLHWLDSTQESSFANNSNLYSVSAQLGWFDKM